MWTFFRRTENWWRKCGMEFRGVNDSYYSRMCFYGTWHMREIALNHHRGGVVWLVGKPWNARDGVSPGNSLQRTIVWFETSFFIPMISRFLSMAIRGGCFREKLDRKIRFPVVCASVTCPAAPRIRYYTSFFDTPI